MFVTVKSPSRNSTAGHHSAATISPWPYPCHVRANEARHPGPPGVITPTCADDVLGTRKVYRTVVLSATTRDRAHIAAFFGGFVLAEPGLTRVPA